MSRNETPTLGRTRPDAAHETGGLTIDDAGLVQRTTGGVRPTLVGT
jgi:hypothetical protein